MKIMKLWMLVAVAAMGFTACSKDATEEVAAQPQPNKVTIRFGADTEDDTRVTIEDKVQIWQDKDAVGIFLTENSVNELATATVDQNTVEFTAEVFDFNAGDLLYAYYPHSDNNDGLTPEEIILTIPNEQLQNAADEYDGSNNPMVSVPLAMTEAGELGEITLPALWFRPLGSIAQFKLYTSATDNADEEIEYITFTADKPLAGDLIIFDLTTVTKEGELTIDGCDQNIVSTVLANAAALPGSKEEAVSIYMVVAPGTYSGTIEVKTNKATYTKQLANEITFNRAKVKPLSLDLATAESDKQPEPELVPTGNVVILAEKDGVYYAVSSDKNGTSNRRENTEFIYNGEAIVSSVENSKLIWNIQKIADNYTIQSAATSEYLNSGSNTAPLSSTAEKFAITLNNDYYEIVPSGGDYTGRRFEQNNNKAGFGFYLATSNQNHNILIIPVILKPMVSVPEKTITLTAVDTEEHTFTCSVSGEGADMANVTMTQTSGDDWLTASFANGTVTYQANSANTGEEARTATLTLSIADGNSVTVTITQAGVKNKEQIIYTLDFATNPASDGKNHTGYGADSPNDWTAKDSQNNEWTIHNFNTNYTSWNCVKCGTKNGAATAYIATGWQVSEAITKVTVVYPEIKEPNNISAVKLQVSTSSDFAAENIVYEKTDITPAVETQTYTIPVPKANCYYRLVYDMAKAKANGALAISQISITDSNE